MDGFPSYQGGVNNSQQNFSKLSQTISSNIQKISQNVSSMQKMLNQLGTSQDSQDLLTQLRQIQHYTQQLAKDTSSLLKEMMAIPLVGPDQTQKKLIRDKLSEDYMDTLNVFQKAQKMAAEKTKDDVRKAKAHSDPYGIPPPPSSQLIEMEATSMHRQEQAQISESELRELEERQNDVVQLENDIAVVNQIFIDLGAIIHDQGATIGTIESAVENAHSRVNEGTEQLRQASGYQSKLRRKKVYIAIVMAIVILIIGIIIFR